MGHRHISRRKFIGQAGCAAMSSTTVLSTLLNLKALNAAALSNSSVIDANDYKALVCISLSGGNDGYNMLVPTTAGEYTDYANVRTNLAIQQQDLLSLNSLNTPGRTFGLHPSMPNVKALFDNQQAAFVANVGTLIEPLTVSEFWNQTKPAPLGLLSHSDQLQQWMTAVPHERASTGWGGKIADMINQMNNSPDLTPNGNTDLSMNISLGGTNLFQTGVESIEYTVDPYGGITEIYGYNDDWQFNTIKKNAIDQILNRTYADIYEKTYANITKKSRDGWLTYKDALEPINLNTDFTPQSPNPDYHGVTMSMEWVAKMIAARDTLGFKRQTFFVDFGGWDHHDEVINAQAEMLAELDYAINQFQLAMAELTASNCVVTFLISDFARTLRSNGNGTDHAWGSHMLTVGGPVIGSRIYGTYPETLDPAQSPDDLGGGIVLPTTSADAYFAELAHWFGVSKSDLELIFPNLVNFYDYRIDPGNPMNFLTIS